MTKKTLWTLWALLVAMLLLLGGAYYLAEHLLSVKRTSEQEHSIENRTTQSFPTPRPINRAFPQQPAQP